MIRRLADFDGTVLYLDAMLLVGLLHARSAWHGAARQLFKRAIDPERPIRLVTAALTIDEVIFVLLQELLLEPPHQITRSRSQYLAAHPDVVRGLMTKLTEPIRNLLHLVTVELVLTADITIVLKEMAENGLLPRDAIHVAVMRRLGIPAIASDDDAFAACAGITLYKP